MEREQPEVTVVDPDAVGGRADVLSSGVDRPVRRLPRRPRRPRPSLRAAALVVVALVVVGGGAWRVQDQRTEDREQTLDRATLARVDLTLSVLSTGGYDTQIEVVNAGPDPVQVTQVALDRAVSWHPAVGTDLLPGATFTDTLPRPRCDRDQARQAFTQVAVTVRTTRGGTATRTTVLSANVSEELGRVYREQCGFQFPAEALLWNVVRADADGDDWVVTYGLANPSQLPLTLTALRNDQGLTVQARELPFDVAPGTFGDTGRWLRVRLHADDCAKVQRTLTGGPTGAGVDVLHLRAALTGDDEHATAPLPIDGEVDPHDPFFTKAQRHFRALCHVPPPPAG